MEDYIFIIVAIILSVVSAINKKKKKQAAAQGRGKSSPKKPTVLEQLFHDSFFDDEEIQEQPAQVEQPKPDLIKREVFKHRRIPATVKTPKETPTDFIKESNPAKKIRKSIRANFSLKDAVIYSEILNRKY